MKKRAPSPRGPTRRECALGLLASAAGLSVAGAALADDEGVPIDLQMKLLVKVAGYDKNLPKRAGEQVNIAVYRKKDDGVSAGVAEQAVRALGEHGEVAGLKAAAFALDFSSASDVKSAVATRRLAIVYFAPGLTRKEVEELAVTLEGVSVLSATFEPTDVPRGLVLGFDVVSGKPKILVNLGQAKKQDVALSADLLKLAKVYE